MLRDLKLRRLLGNGGDEEADVADSKVPGNKLDQMKELYESEGPALNEYKQHISSQPRREDYGNSNGRKLLAGVVGAMQAFGSKDPAGGIATTTGILDSRYKNALSDYGRKAEGLEAAAGLEEKSRNSKIKYLIDSQDLIRKERDTDSLVDSRVAKARTDEANSVSLGDYRNRQAATGVRNADTNARRADLYGQSVNQQGVLGARRASAAERQADAAMMNAGTGVNRERRLKSGAGTKPPTLSAAEEKLESAEALKAVAIKNPAFTKFISPRGGILVAGGENMDEPYSPEEQAELEAFYQAVEFEKDQRKKKRLKSKSIVTLPADDPDDDEDYEVIEE